MKRTLLLCLVVCIACVTPGYGAQTVSKLRGIPLEWKPTEAISSYGAIDVSAYHNAHFVIRPFTDVRTQPADIGINTEKRFSGRDMHVTTRQNVAGWLTGKCAKVFSQFGINAVTSNGTFFVDAAVVSFFVTESSDYNADVSLNVTLTAKNGTVVWKGMTTGNATRFGRSHKAENYYEALSNATISAVHGLLNNDSFKRAVLENI
ncbi:MAG: hypothetical protein HXX11_05760 [Desulfuromonadales bacterium]|nr:hypothetical protein [Desulfuromonadales bacterium]